MERGDQNPFRFMEIGTVAVLSRVLIVSGYELPRMTSSITPTRFAGAVGNLSTVEWC